MTLRATARACANIALIKYWGKLPGNRNLPATPSVSLALENLVTETTVERLPRGPDRFSLDSRAPDSTAASRLKAYLDVWRRRKFIHGHFAIVSQNHFPTSAGLASSSSGFAALATALGALSERPISRMELSRLARLGSGSAARSVIGGLAALPVGADPAARSLMSSESIPWAMVVVIVSAEQKRVGSRTGMQHCRKSSPYYRTWLSQAHSDFRAMLKAVKREDFTRIGELCEANALAMHACMLAARPALIYWTPATLAVINAIGTWRQAGLETYFTIDAGPNPILLCSRRDLARVRAAVLQIPGVQSALECLPGGPSAVTCLT